MKRLLLASLLGSFTLLGCGAPPDSDGPASETQAPIAFGTSDSTHTAVVALLTDSGGGSFSQCSGTIVQIKNSQGYVLTAAHCCNTDPPQLVIVSNNYTVGEQYLGGGNPVAPVYKVVAGSVYYDTLYNGNDHDFCMLKFSGATGAMSTIPVASPGQDGLAIGVDVEHVGFGITDTNSNNAGRRTGTEQLDQNLTSNILQWSQGGGSHIPGPCEGDSGGPALTPAGAAQGQQVVVGTTSFGNSQSCASDTMGVASRVTSETGAGGFITNFLADTPSGTPGGTQPTNCGLTTGDATCDTCLDNACCTASQDCANDPSCTACLVQNPAPSCNSNAHFNALDSCLAASCGTACGISGGSCGLSSNDPTCNTCLDTSCCNQGLACSNDATCLSCLSNPTASCNSDAAFAAVAQCLDASCATACGAGSGSSGTGATTGSGLSTGSGTAGNGAGTTGSGVGVGVGVGAGPGSGAGGSGGGSATGGATTGAQGSCSATPSNDGSHSGTLAGLLLGAALVFSRRRR